MTTPAMEVVEPKRTAVLQPSQTQPVVTTPAQLLEIAVSQGADLEKLERLMALQERWEANEARKEFVLAMAAFKQEPLEIFKRKEVGYTTKEGEFVGYKHATLSDVANVVVPAMARYDLSHRWDVRQEGGRIIVTCVVTHKRGHSETVTLDGAPDSSGKKNQIQQVASTVTYLQRYTLLLATGLAAQDQLDDDGQGAGKGETDIGDLFSELYEIKVDQKALQVWQQRREALRGDAGAYGRFKQAVADHRRSISGGAQ